MNENEHRKITISTSTVDQLLASVDADKAQDDRVLAQLAKLASVNQEALLAVVYRVPRLSGLGDPDDLMKRRRVRRELVGYLTHCVPGLISILEAWTEPLSRSGKSDREAEFRAELAAEILGDIGEPAVAAVPALIRAMHADPRWMGEISGPALGKIGSEEAIRELNHIWFSGWDRKLCESCHGALMDLGERAHPVLLRIIDETDPVDRARALHSLRAAHYPEKDLAALAQKLLGDGSIPVIETAINVLAGFDDPTQAASALDKLREISADEEHYFERTRIEAAKAVTRISEQLSRSSESIEKEK